jgi:protocatechuate 3,4-dioxygenase beta subunit
MADEPGKPAVAAGQPEEMVQARLHSADIALRTEQQAPPAPSAEPPACRGHVLDSHGRPLPRVPLVVVEKLAEEANAALGARPFDLAAQPVVTTSADDGGFALPRQHGHLLAGSGFATLRAPLLDMPAIDLLVVAMPAIQVRGLVVDGAANPIAGVTVIVRLPPLGDFPVPLDNTCDNTPTPLVTAADGTFWLPDLPAALGELSFERQGFVTAVQPMPAVSTDLRVQLDQSARHRLVVAGHVVDGAGLAVAQALVGLYGASTHSDDQGAFRLVFDGSDRAPLPSSPLFASRPGYRTRLLRDFGARAEQAGDVILQLDGPTLAIAGRVVDDSGTPVPRALVYLWDEPALLGNSTAEELAMPADAPVEKVGTPLRVWSRTDERGAFELHGLGERDYRLRVLLESRQAAFTSQPVAAGSRGVEVRLPAQLAHEVKGRVVGQDGRPVAGVQLSAGLMIYRAGGCAFFDNVSRAVSGEDGSFDLRGVPVAEAQIGANGDAIMPGQLQLDSTRPLDDQRFAVVRRCHFRVQVERKDVDGFVVLDAADQPLEIMRIGTDGSMSARQWVLEDGNSGVLAVGEIGVAVVLRSGSREVARLPLRLTPGEVTAVRY